MAKIYIARLELRCDPTDAATLAEFYKRWTPPIAASWNALSLIYDDFVSDAQNQARLALFLTQKIDTQYAHLTKWIPGDIAATQPAGKTYKGPLNVFTSVSWNVGPGNVHEADQPILGVLNDDSLGQWAFRIPGAGTGFVYARVGWRLYDYTL